MINRGEALNIDQFYPVWWELVDAPLRWIAVASMNIDSADYADYYSPSSHNSLLIKTSSNFINVYGQRISYKTNLSISMAISQHVRDVENLGELHSIACIHAKKSYVSRAFEFMIENINSAMSLGRSIYSQDVFSGTIAAVELIKSNISKDKSPGDKYILELLSVHKLYARNIIENSWPLFIEDMDPTSHCSRRLE